MVSYAKAVAVTPRNTGEEWFAADVSQAPEASGKARQFRIYYTTAGAVAVEYTLDSGANWIAIETSAIDTYRAPIYIPIRDGDLFNMRHGTAATSPLVVCRVDSVLTD